MHKRHSTEEGSYRGPGAPIRRLDPPGQEAALQSTMWSQLPRICQAQQQTDAEHASPPMRAVSQRSEAGGGTSRVSYAFSLRSICSTRGPSHPDQVPCPTSICVKRVAPVPCAFHPYTRNCALSGRHSFCVHKRTDNIHMEGTGQNTQMGSGYVHQE